jgi:hypothetical protein
MNYLTFKGEQYPVRVSYYALKQYQVETGKGIESIDEDLTNLETLLYYSLVAGSKAEDKELPLKKEDMEFFLDESLTEFNEILMGSFPDATKGGSKKK